MRFLEKQNILNKMELPCTNCKFRTERKRAHRVFIGCKDKEKKKGFIEDNYFYRHKCTNYEKDEGLI